MVMQRVYEREKETENTWRFKEVKVEGEPLLSGTMYVRKDALAALGDPEAIVVRVARAG